MRADSDDAGVAGAGDRRQQQPPPNANDLIAAGNDVEHPFGPDIMVRVRMRTTLYRLGVITTHTLRWSV